MPIHPQAQRVLDQDPRFGDDFDPADTIHRRRGTCWTSANALLSGQGRKWPVSRTPIFRGRVIRGG
jgi:hypothetical protein